MDGTSAFEIIGPKMIGPSSSHTAGALKIAQMACKLVEGNIKNVHFILYGSFARTYKGHGTDKALLAGILGFETDDIRIRDAYRYIAESGISYVFEADYAEQEIHPNTVDIIITGNEEQTTKIRGVSVGGGKAVITGINGADIRLTNEYNMVFTTQEDVPGVVTHITGCFAKAAVNIAFMSLFRKEKGVLAYTVIEVDGIIPHSVLDSIRDCEHIINAVMIC